MDDFYEGFRREPNWVADPDPAYLRDTISDLRLLSKNLQSELVLVDVGEASWPSRLIESAIDALADLGRPLRCLEAEPVLVDGVWVGKPLSLAEEDDVEVTRQRMLHASHLLGAEERGILVWEPGSNLQE